MEGEARRELRFAVTDWQGEAIAWFFDRDEATWYASRLAAEGREARVMECAPIR